MEWMRASATLSPCGRYRYVLERRWAPGGRLLVVLLNPSFADASLGDATLSRCILRARRLGFGALRVVNLFALRSPDPGALRRAADPVGPGNDAAILGALRGAGAVLCGWGNHGLLQGRAAQVRGLLQGRQLWHLGLSARGQPRHPLYAGAAVALQVWE